MVTERKQRVASNERGISLIIAMLVLLVLSVLATGLMLISQTEIWTTANYRELAQARYAAEAGVQSTINYLQYNYTAPTTFTAYTMTTNPVQCASGCTATGSPVILSAISTIASNYPDSTQQSNFNTALSNQAIPGESGATFSTSAKLIAMTQAGAVSWLSSGVMQTWQITSQGTVNGVRTATVQVVATYQRTGTPIFTAGVVATGSGCTVNGVAPVYFNGKCDTNTGATGPCTDSYNSSSGAYSSTNSSTTGGNVYANGFVNLNGATVDGNIYTSGNTAVGSSCPTDGVETGSGSDGGIIKSNTVNEPCPWGCATCGSTACYPSGVTPVTTTQTVNSTFCPSSGSTTGCTPHSPSTIKLYDGTSSSETTVNQYNLAPGTYGNLTWPTSGGAAATDAVIYLQGGGTYNINSINFGSANGQFVVQGAGSVVINITGAGTLPSEGGVSGNVPTAIYEAGLGGFNLCNTGNPGNPGQLYSSGSTLGANCDTASTGAVGSGSTTTNPISGIPADMQIVYAGTGQMRVGGAPNSLVIYMPNAPFYQPGGAVGLFGSIVSNTFVDDSNSPFHFDQALLSNTQKVGSYQLVGFSWSKF